MLYHFVNKGVECKFTPKLIVHQVGNLITQFIFPPDPESNTSLKNGVVAFSYMGHVQTVMSSLYDLFQHEKSFCW